MIDQKGEWWDKDTEILLESETYDPNGDLTSYVHPDRGCECTIYSRLRGLPASHKQSE